MTKRDIKGFRSSITERGINILIVAIFLFIVFYLDITVAVVILALCAGLLFLNFKGAFQGALLGIGLGLIIAVIVSGITGELTWLLAIAPYSVIGGLIVGLYIGGFIGMLLHGPSNKFISRTLAKTGLHGGIVDKDVGDEMK